MNPSTESVLDFPCRFPIKVMGPADEDFSEMVYSIALRHAPDLAPGALTSRASTGGRYQSVTVTINATSRAQLDGLYRELSAAERVLMVL